jgi:hypothetical protein
MRKRCCFSVDRPPYAGLAVLQLFLAGDDLDVAASRELSFA